MSDAVMLPTALSVSDTYAKAFDSSHTTPQQTPAVSTETQRPSYIMSCPPLNVGSLRGKIYSKNTIYHVCSSADKSAQGAGLIIGTVNHKNGEILFYPTLPVF